MDSVDDVDFSKCCLCQVRSVINFIFSKIALQRPSNVKGVNLNKNAVHIIFLQVGSTDALSHSDEGYNHIHHVFPQYDGTRKFLVMPSMLDDGRGIFEESSRKIS